MDLPAVLAGERRVAVGLDDVAGVFWQEDLRAHRRAMSKHDDAKQSYLEEGLLILSLAQEAPDLFEKATRDEKRELLTHLVSNSSCEAGRLTVEWRKPYVFLAEFQDPEGGEPPSEGDLEGGPSNMVGVTECLSNLVGEPGGVVARGDADVRGELQPGQPGVGGLGKPRAKTQSAGIAGAAGGARTGREVAAPGELQRDGKRPPERHHLDLRQMEQRRVDGQPAAT